MRDVLGNSTDPLDSDTDDDGMPDGWEKYYNLNPLEDYDADDDQDDDGYDSNRDNEITPNERHTNLEEYLAGTSPWQSDTDGDKMPDGWEVIFDINPYIKTDKF